MTSCRLTTYTFLCGALWCGLFCGVSFPAIAGASADDSGKPPPYPAWAVYNPYAKPKTAAPEEKKTAEEEAPIKKAKPYPDWAVVPYDPHRAAPPQQKSASKPYPDWAVFNPYAPAPGKDKRAQDSTKAGAALPHQNDSHVLKVTIPNIHAMRPAAPEVKVAAEGGRRRNLAVPPIHNPAEDEKIVIYQSPPPIIRKEVIHMASAQQAAPAKPSLIPSLTPQQLEALAPSAGEDTSAAPLPPAPQPASPPLPLPPVPPPAAEDTPPVADNKPLLPLPPEPLPAAKKIPAQPAAAVANLSDVKPLLPLPPATPPAAPPPAAPVPAAAPSSPSPAPDAASLDTLLRTASETKSPAAPALPDAIPLTPSQEKESEHDSASVEQQNKDSSEPEATLSPQSEKVLKHIPSELGRRKTVSRRIDIARARNSQDLGDAEPEVKTIRQDGMNISIGYKKPKIDSTYELEQAYNALASGQTSEAVEIYKNILSNDPRNKSALFALATTYHRAGQLDLARPLYARLLAIDPKNRDGLNNFLVLLADEAPEDALKQMQSLEMRSPEFSPIPAQMGVIYAKLGNLEMASQKMFRAVELEPENLTYRYNLAIILDKQGKYDEAARLYRDIVTASERGEATPGNIDKIQQRLTFISSNRG